MSENEESGYCLRCDGPTLPWCGHDPKPSPLLRASTSVSRLSEHVEAARIQAFTEVLAAVNASYRRAFADFERLALATPHISREERQALSRVDAWREAVHLVRKIRDDAIESVRPSPEHTRTEHDNCAATGETE